MNIFLDLDGVCVDFVPAIHEVLSQEPWAEFKWPKDVYNLAFVYPNFKQEHLEQYSYSWWATLSKTLCCDALIKRLKRAGHAIFFASGSCSPNAAKGKTLWVKKHFPGIPFILIMDKYLLAGNGVLIDDSWEQVNWFRKLGGQAILFPRPWNNADCKINVVDYIMEKVDENCRFRSSQ